jgi:hypothetical protein
MSAASTQPFETDGLPIDGIESGASILLTGEDPDALEAIFNRLVATRENESGVVLSTDADGRSIKRALDGIARGAGDRSTVLTAAGSGRGDGIETVSDIADLTGTGMQLSTELAEARQEAARFRTGIYLCTSICAEIEDTRSVYRFLNSNFLTDLRRGDGIGVCALDTTAEVGSDVSSIAAGLETSFTGRIDIVESDGRTATLEVSGLGDADGTVDVSL